MDDKTIIQQLVRCLPADLVPEKLFWSDVLAAVAKMKQQNQDLRERAASLFHGMHGCGSHSCYVKKPTGMGNNGPCRCAQKSGTANIIMARAAGLVNASKKVGS